MRMKLKFVKSIVAMLSLVLFFLFVTPIFVTAENTSTELDSALVREPIHLEDLYDILETLPSDALISKNFESGELSIAIESLAETFGSNLRRRNDSYFGAPPISPTIESSDEWMEIIEDDAEDIPGAPGYHRTPALNELPPSFRDNYSFDFNSLVDFDSYIPIQGLNLPPKGVIGSDDRVRVNPPLNALAYIEMTFNDGTRTRCSASVIGWRVLLTSGHCIYDKENGLGLARSVIVQPGRDHFHLPFGTFSGVEALILDGWMQTGQTDYDIAFIVLGQDIAHLTGAFGWGTGINTNSNISVLGYPQEVVGTSPGITQWVAHGTPRRLPSNRIVHGIDSTRGQSGGPVILTNSPTIVGVNSAVYRLSLGNIVLYAENTATRINPLISELMLFLRYL